jgi:formylglycine-generating enzyme required for sulfatase activity/tRNA A-37 threonylcarbamoyl transferase component Bud32
MHGSEEQAEQALIDYALERGYLRPEQVEQARAQVARARAQGQPLGLMAALAQRLPQHLHAELSTVYQRSSSGRLARPGPQSGVVSLGGAPTVVEASGRAPTQVAPGANAHDVVQGLQEVYQRIPDFAPHANLVLERLSELGKGGMGAVYRVRDSRLGREAALKVILGEADAASLERFRREAEITARLDHPAIPPVYEAGTTAAGEAYMLMRVIEGETLSLRIKDLQPGGLDPAGTRDLLQVLVQVGQAMAYAHDQGVVHRDLKPDNVMVGAFGEVLVMDWGLAREEGKEEVSAVLELGRTQLDAAEAQAAGLTQAGSVMGTPGYMAPEQADGLPADARSDVYALGAILVEALTGRPPVTGKSALQIVLATAEGKVELPRDRRPATPAELNSIARKALALEARDRYASAEEFASDLQAYLTGQPVSAHDYGLLERLLAIPGRYPRLIGSALLALSLAVIGVLALAWSSSERGRVAAEQAATEAKEERTRAERERERAEDATAAAEAARVKATANEQAAREQRLRAEASELQARQEKERALAAERRGRSFSDAAKLELLQRQLSQLVPRSDIIQLWLQVARDVLSRADERSQRLRELSQLSQKGPVATQALAELSVLNRAKATTRALRTVVPREEARLADLDRLELESLRSPRAVEAWRRAAEQVAASPRYSNLRLVPQPGLLPLGLDPQSGLLELWHVASGTEPPRSEAGHLRVEGPSGLVFVLIPGGTFQMGHPNQFDARPVREVKIPPFLLSKFELTNLQWRRGTSNTVGAFQPGKTIAGQRIGDNHPVERVSRLSAEMGLCRFGLRLPSEAEWEYAARAGGGRWAGRSSGAALEGYANMADLNYRNAGGQGADFAGWDDGFLLHAPVGSFKPNAFGLHDMAGNVFEWVQDVYHAGYEHSFPDQRPTTFYPDGMAPRFAYRGGGYATGWRDACSTSRRTQLSAWVSKELGFRPARTLRR